MASTDDKRQSEIPALLSWMLSGNFLPQAVRDGQRIALVCVVLTLSA